MILESHRLKVFPLSPEQVQLYVLGNDVLERALGLEHSYREISADLAEALKEAILPLLADESKDYRYHTLWTIVDKGLNRMVGDFCFKGMPDPDGAVEIGYGTYEHWQGKGYMTEAVGMMVKWAFGQPGLSTLLAETDKGNIASHRTLERNDFSPFKTTDQMIWWKIEKHRP